MYLCLKSMHRLWNKQTIYQFIIQDVHSYPEMSTPAAHGDRCHRTCNAYRKYLTHHIARTMSMICPHICKNVLHDQLVFHGRSGSPCSKFEIVQLSLQWDTLYISGQQCCTAQISCVWRFLINVGTFSKYFGCHKSLEKWCMTFYYETEMSNVCWRHNAHKCHVPPKVLIQRFLSGCHDHTRGVQILNFRTQWHCGQATIMRKILSQAMPDKNR